MLNSGWFFAPASQYTQSWGSSSRQVILSSVTIRGFGQWWVWRVWCSGPADLFLLSFQDTFSDGIHRKGAGRGSQDIRPRTNDPVRRSPPEDGELSWYDVSPAMSRISGLVTGENEEVVYCYTISFQNKYSTEIRYINSVLWREGQTVVEEVCLAVVSCLL